MVKRIKLFWHRGIFMCQPSVFLSSCSRASNTLNWHRNSGPWHKWWQGYTGNTLQWHKTWNFVYNNLRKILWKNYSQNWVKKYVMIHSFIENTFYSPQLIFVRISEIDKNYIKHLHLVPLWVSYMTFTEEGKVRSWS